MDELEAGRLRLEEAVAQLDPRTNEILGYHAALYRELRHALAGRVEEPEELSGISMYDLLKILRATWGPEFGELRDKITDEMLASNALRNAVAHGAARAKVEAKFLNLVELMFGQYTSLVPGDRTVKKIAQLIFFDMFLAQQRVGLTRLA